MGAQHDPFGVEAERIAETGGGRGSAAHRRASHEMGSAGRSWRHSPKGGVRRLSPVVLPLILALSLAAIVPATSTAASAQHGLIGGAHNSNRPLTLTAEHLPAAAGLVSLTANTVGWQYNTNPGLAYWSRSIAGTFKITLEAPSQAPSAAFVPTDSTGTSLYVSTSGSPSFVSAAVTYTGTVTATTPGAGTPGTGNVVFYDGGTAISVCGGGSGEPVDSSGKATCTVTYRATGSHTITGQYLGSLGFPASPVSSSITQLVEAATTSTGWIATTGTPSAVGEEVIYTGSVSATSPGASTPGTGNLEFFDGGKAISVCGGTSGRPLNSSGNATCTVTYRAVGAHTINAQYLGSAGFAPSAVSPAFTQLVLQAATSTAVLSTTGSPSVVGKAVTYTGTVSATAPGSGTPATGHVRFYDGGAPVSVCGGASGEPVNSSARATCTVTYQAAGAHSITAQYLGSTDFASSVVSPAFTQLVTSGPPRPPRGYYLEGGDGGLFGFHKTFFGSIPPPKPPGLGLHIFDFVAMAASAKGYWLAESNGGVWFFNSFGGTQLHGSIPGVNDIVGIAATSDGGGYWLAGRDGSIYAFGDANAHGSLSGAGVHDIVAISSPDGGGYWLAGADGGVFGFGDAHYYGSCPGTTSTCRGVHDIVGIASDGAGGYWLAGANGGVFGFGNAHYYGSCPSSGCGTVRDVVGIASPDASGYWLAESDGNVLAFGDAKFVGRCGTTGSGCNPLARPIVGISA